MTFIPHLDIFGFLVLFSGIWPASLLIQWLATLPARRHGTSVRLNGPPRDSFILGVIRQLAKSDDVGLLFEQWSATYGPVFQIPTFFGGWRTIVYDPKAVNHFYSMERTVYVKSKLSRAVIANLFGHGLFWAEGDSHKRQRKALTPAFSIAAIRRLTTVFYDSSYKLRAQWDATLETSPDGAIIDVEHWMNRVALDSIGIAGFAHDFHSLDGAYSPVAAAFESFSFDGLSFFSNLVFILGQRFPLFAYLPLKRNRIIAGLHRALSAIADDILQRSRHEKMSRCRGVDDSEAGDRSVIGLLLKSEDEEAILHMDQSEVLAQMNVLLVAGYETTSVSLTWALIELARNPSKQAKLRKELVGFGAGDPTYDQLGSGLLPYLDAVVLETLRLHPPVAESTREAIVDDVLPLREPVTTKSGETVHAIAVAKGSIVTVHIRSVNRSAAFWGPDAKEFKPERWLTLGDGDDPHTVRARELQGHRHLLTFIDGPRACLGKSFAIAEFKAVLIMLVRNFTYEFPDGPETTIVRRRGLVPRPAVQGQPAANVPLRVRRVE